jgi:pimeloyl-ACP methyl ester carboxylesterase
MPRRLRALVLPVLILAALYLGLCLLMFLTQRSQIYFPVRESAAAGASALPFESDGATLRIWTVERAGPAALIYFGGNAEDVGASIGVFAARLPDHSLYFVNYRGYGGSTGRPSEDALVGDAIALYDRLHARHPEISVLGRSLGSGVAVQLAGERHVERLVLVTPFDSLVNVARAHFSWLPVALLMIDRYDSGARAQSVGAPVLVVAAEADEIVPRARTDALIDAFKIRPRVIVLNGARHNDLDLDPAYLREVVDFLAPATRPDPAATVAAPGR